MPTLFHDIFVDALLSIPLIGAYIVLALGIVVIFRASRVLNLAHGAMALLPAYLYYQLAAKWHVPIPVALALGVASGGALGYLVERIFVRPLRHVSPTAQTVGTVAAFGVIVAVVAKVFGTLTLRVPSIFPSGGVSVGATTLGYGAIGLFITGLIVSVGLFALFRFTDFGLAMRAAADNRRAASLMGVDPQATTTAAWVLGGATAGLAGILLGAATSIEPYTLSLQALPAFVTVLIGGLESLIGAMAGGAIVGLMMGLVPLVPLVGDQQGAPQLMLMILAFAVMVVRGSRFQASDVRAEDVSADAGTRSSSRTAAPRWQRLRGDVKAVLIALLLLFPALPGVGSNLIGDANLALQYGLVGMSLVLLIGLVGQISLAQASFVGIGAFVTGLVIDHMHVPFPANTPLAAIASGVCATVLGVVALRVRGLYLAVATLIFAWMCDAYLFQQSWLVGEGGSRAFAVPHVGVDVGFPSFDLSDRRTFYYVALAAAAAIAIGIGLLRRSKTGRAFLAVRGSEVAAASLGINVTRYKLLAFGISGVVAGVAGNLFAVNTGAITTSEFSFTVSLFYLSIAVVGGLTSTGGALAAGVVFSLLNELFFQVDALAGYLDIVSAGLLTAVLLAYPGGLAALPGTLRGPRRRAEMAVVSLSRRLKPVLDHLRPLIAERAGLFRRAHAGAVVVPSATGSSGTASGEALTPKQRLTRLLFATTESTSTPLPSGAETEAAGLVVLPHAMSQPAQTASLAELIAARPSDLVELTVHREDRDPVLAAEHVSMRFGGLLAVDDVSLTVRQGEIVGLIGPNGAGKTTTFNCISGLLVPSAGAVSLFGKDVTRVPVHERAYMGLGRTFQVIQLFPQLTVFDNLLVATHTSNNTGVLAHLGVTKAALLGERQAREWVGQVLEVMGLQPYSDRQVSGLPFGLLRMVELARALVTGARLVMLDEPASGLDNAETERLTDLLLSLRAGLGLTLLLIEHDVRMVTAVSDYIYVLDRGRLLAEGTAHDVQRNSAVIAAYLGEPVGEVVA